MTHFDAVIIRLRNFRDLARTRLDAENLLFAVPTLIPAVLISPTDNSTLLRMTGTVPIAYQGQNYDIPVELQIKPSYPYERPIFFVRPTPDMMIYPNHPCVNSAGEVTHAYLTRWHHQESNLAELVALACQAFSSTPPVYSRKPGSSSSTSATTTTTMAQPQQPYRPDNIYHPPDRPPPTYASAAPPPAYHPPVIDKKIEEEKTQQRLVAIISARLKKSLKEEFNPAIKREFKEEMELQSQLENGSEEISKCCARLREYNAELETQKEQLEFRLVTLRSWIDGHAKTAAQKPPPNMDDLAQPADVLTTQLFENVAEINAIEDSLFHLDRALHRGKIDLKTFLKHVRDLSRNQFLCTALSLKIMEINDATATRGGMPRYPALS